MKLNIAVLPGDGIGPEIMKQALKVTEAICSKFHTSSIIKKLLLAPQLMPPVIHPAQTHELCMQSDAILFGAIMIQHDNDPNAKVRPEQGLLYAQTVGSLRKYSPCNILLLLKSPLRADLADGADFVCIRELTVAFILVVHKVAAKMATQHTIPLYIL